MKRRLLSICMALALCLGLLPTAALAVDDETVTYGTIEVGGKALTNSADTPTVYATTDQNGTVTTEGATAENYNVMWDGATLTLRNATIKEAKEYTEKGNEKIAIYLASGDLALALVGKNTVDALGDGSAASCGINLGNGSLSISGENSASLTVYGGPTEHGNSCGIYARGTITINSGTVTATGESASAASYGIYARGTITIEGGTVNATSGEAGGNSVGIHITNSITVNGGTVTATSGEAEGDSCGIFAESQTGASDGSSVTIKSGTVTARAGNAVGGGWYSCGIRAEGAITVNDGTVNVKGGNAAGTGDRKYSSGLFANVNITVNDGTVIATGGEATGTGTQRYSTGLYTYRDITINSGTVTATAGNAVGTGTYSYSFGLCAQDNIIINSGTVTATAGNAGSGTNNCSSGFFAFDNLTISGGDVTGIGGTGEMSWGIACNDILTITGSTVVGEGGPLAGTNIQYSAGVNGMGKVEISGSTVTGTGGDTEAGDSFGICTGDTTSYNVVTVSIKDATVTATGGTATNGKSSGISATNTIADVKVTIENAAVTATGGSAGTGSYGILAETTGDGKSADVTINGNSVVRTNMTGEKDVDGELISDKTTTPENSIVFENGVGTVYGNVELQENLNIEAGESLNIPSGTSLTIPEGKTLTNSGTITNEGTLTNNGTLTIGQGGTLTGNTVTGNPLTYAVTVQPQGNGSASASLAVAKEGDTVTLTASPGSGSHFERWEVVSGSVTIENNAFIMPAQPVTVRAVFDRNSSGPTRYAVTVPDDIEGGTVKASPIRASRGQTVTLTVKPDEGCVLDELAVYDADGDALELERANANQYQFTMPRGKVEIEVSFRELPPEPLPFRDVPAGHWAETAIRYVWENGLMAGTGETAFGPDDPLTRGQLVTILWRAAGSPQVDYLMDFSDVSQGSWYGEAIRWACAEGIAGGYGGGLFGPDAPITREQLAVMLYQYAGWAGHDVSGGAALGNYLDAGDASAWAVEALEWALDAGIVGGVSPTALDPQGQATRAQAAVMLTRLCELDR